MRTWKLVSQQYRAWSDCTDVQAGLALYWWQRLITFGFNRIRVNVYHVIILILEYMRFKNRDNIIRVMLSGKLEVHYIVVNYLSGMHVLTRNLPESEVPFSFYLNIYIYF